MCSRSIVEPRQQGRPWIARWQTDKEGFQLRLTQHLASSALSVHRELSESKSSDQDGSTELSVTKLSDRARLIIDLTPDLSTSVSLGDKPGYKRASSAPTSTSLSSSSSSSSSSSATSLHTTSKS
eukprot:g17315.t1